MLIWNLKDCQFNAEGKVPVVWWCITLLLIRYFSRQTSMRKNIIHMSWRPSPRYFHFPFSFRIARWLVYMQGFTFGIGYKTGINQKILLISIYAAIICKIQCLICVLKKPRFSSLQRFITNVDKRHLSISTSHADSLGSL